MKEQGLSHWVSPNLGATNESGFTGLPGGYRTDLGTYYGLGQVGFFWTSNKLNSVALIWYLQHDAVQIFDSGRDLNYGLSIRCIKD